MIINKLIVNNYISTNSINISLLIYICNIITTNIQLFRNLKQYYNNTNHDFKGIKQY